MASPMTRSRSSTFSGESRFTGSKMIRRFRLPMERITSSARSGFQTMWVHTGSMASVTPRRSASATTGSNPRKKAIRDSRLWQAGS